MDKYRVRLRNGRVVGPFLPGQIIEMRHKGYVHGLESCQVFPSGDWLPLNQFQFWSEVKADKTITEGTFVLDIHDSKELHEQIFPASETEKKDEIENQNESVEENVDEDPLAGIVPESLSDSMESEEEKDERRKKSREPQIFREFDYRQAVNRKEESRLFELADLEDKSFDEVSKIDAFATKQKIEREESKRVLKISIKQKQKEELSTDREKAEREKKEVESNATIVTPAGKAWKEHLEEEKRKKEEIQKRWEEDERARKENEAKLKSQDNTQFREGLTQVINLKALTTLKDEAKRAEIEILDIEKRERDQALKHKAELERIGSEIKLKEESDEQEEERANRKKKLFLALGAIILLAVFMLPSEEAKKKSIPPIVPIAPEIVFPVPFNEKDNQKANVERTKAQQALSVETYMGKRSAAIHYRLSYENDISQVNLIPKLIRLYGWLIPHSGQFESDGTVMFKLIRSNKIQLPIDPDICLGTAYFYKALGKSEAAFNVLDRFVKSKSNKPSKELFAAYLDSLIERNNESKADEVAASLEKVENKGVEVVLSLINYHRYKNHPEIAREVLDLAMDKKSTSVPLLIARAEFELEAANIKALNLTVKKIRELGAEKSRLYYGRLMEFVGFVLAYQNQPAKAAVAFKEAIKFADSELLQDKLTNIKNIDPTANDEASKLIKQIKSRELVKKSERALEKFDFENGLLYAIEAQSLNSGYMKADYHLAEVQLRLGMTKDALDTLESLQKINPGDQVANQTLLRAYIDTYKFNDAKRMLTVLAASEMRDTWQYASLNARMYEKMGEIAQSILWLQKAINQNPLSDENIFSLAKLLIRAKNFRQAKNRLFQAMELDPSKVEYKLAYGSIIYEVDGADAAIAYLFGLLQQYPKNPSILGDIAIYYHRAGKSQQFKDTRKDIEELSVQDPRIYRFLIKSSILDEKWDDAVKYTNELIKLEPGELSAMMEIGRVLMSIKRYRDAAAWFVRVRDKLPSYPKVGYYKALIELYVNEPNQALKDVQEDMKLNGQYEEGVILVGDIYRSQEKYTEAEGQYKAALKLNVRSPGAMRGLADLALKRGQLDVALDLFKRAVAEDKDNPDVHRHLGDVYRLQGQASLAIEAYKVYLKLRPDAQDRPQVDQYIRTLE